MHRWNFQRYYYLCAGKQFILFIFKFKSFLWIPQKRLVSHWNKWVSSQIKSTCSVTIKVVNKCFLYIRRISLTSQKGQFDVFPTWYKTFSFSLMNTNKQEILLCNVSENHNKKVHGKGKEGDQLCWEEGWILFSLPPEKYWIILIALCKVFITGALMSTLLMSLTFFMSWKEVVPQNKLERTENAKKEKKKWG